MTERIELPEEVLEKAPRINLSRRAIIKGMAAGTILPIVGGCATLVSDDQLAGLAADAWAELKQQTPETTDPRVRNTVMSTWNRVVAKTPKANEDWEVRVFDDASANAFVMPGNRVGVYRGMVDLTENSDQLSAVMGHEVGHAVKQHAAQRASQQLWTQIGLGAASIAIGQSETLSRYGNEIGLLGGAAVQFGVILPFSRRHETESDKLGADYMHAAGYDVMQSVRLWELMDARSAGQRPPEFMSTHPDPANRAQDLRNYINQQGYALV